QELSRGCFAFSPRLVPHFNRPLGVNPLKRQEQVYMFLAQANCQMAAIQQLPQVVTLNFLQLDRPLTSSLANYKLQKAL
ncbi:MAG: hypothetical protein WB680_00215, partial [Candidatus Acidiferrales bacterium]